MVIDLHDGNLPDSTGIFVAHKKGKISSSASLKVREKATNALRALASAGAN